MKHFIFDFDGVLADSMPVWAGVYMGLLIDNGIEVPPDMIKDITPLGNSGATRYCIEHGLDMPHSTITNFVLEKIEKAYKTDVKLKLFVREILTELHAKGIHLHVLTASSHSYVDPFLKRKEIFDLFDNVWSSDDFALTKSNPEIYKQIATKLNTTPENCTMFDDNVLALSTANAAGMNIVGVYDSSSEELKNEFLKITDNYIYDFSEINNILKSL